MAAFFVKYSTETRCTKSMIRYSTVAEEKLVCNTNTGINIDWKSILERYIND